MTDDPITRSTFADLCGAATDSTVPAGRPGFAYVQTHELLATLGLLAKRGPCVLVTHASDTTATPAMLAAVREQAPNVHHWFAVNCGIRPSEARGMVTALPIGLKSNHPTDEAIAPLRAAAERPQGAAGDDSPLAYCCLNWRYLTEGPAQERRELQDLVGRAWKPWATAETNVPPARFYEQIRAHAYTLCPRGAGPDTHRLHEALHLGSIPIVRRCVALEHFADFPILFVNAWEQVTEALLRERLPELRAMFPAAQEKLAAEYWRKMIVREVENLARVEHAIGEIRKELEAL